MKLHFHVLGNVRNESRRAQDIKDARENVRHQDLVAQQPLNRRTKSSFWLFNFPGTAHKWLRVLPFV